MHFQIGLATALTAAGALAVPVSTDASNSTSPCGIITQQINEFYSDKSNEPKNFLLKPSLAYACLQSSGIDNQLAASYVVELKKYIQFQSSIAYLKNPSADYFYPAVDLLGGLDDMASKAAAGEFTSQYEFDLALNKLVYSVKDGHTFLSTCTSGTISFQRGLEPLPFVSVTEDGTSAPKVYLLDDIYAASNNFSVSSVETINGDDVGAVLGTSAEDLTSDPDANYNRLMWNYASGPVSGSFNGLFSILSTYQYPGDFTNITFSNGTTLSVENIAFIPTGTWDLTIVDGNSFTQYFCVAPANPSPTTSPASPTSTSSPTFGTTAPTLRGYPFLPVVKDPNNQVAGYYLNNTGHEDTAILRIGTFANETANQGDIDPTESFVNTTRDFLTAVRADNKTKLIIDVSGNGGGNTILLNEVFRRIFPNIEPYGLARLRGNPAAEIYGEAFAAVPDEALVVTLSDNDTVQNIKARVFTSPWSYRSWVTEDLQNYTGWSSGDNPYYPPVENNGDNFTASGRIPTNSTLYTETTGGLVLYGTPAEPATEPQLFTPENVIVLTDGICASACSILTEFLTREANVKTIVVGGRPQEGPMQAIGGTKGAQAYTFNNFATQTAYLNSPVVGPYISDDLAAKANATLPGLVNLPLGSPHSLANYGINLRDNIPPGDDAGIPLQFVFEPASCRIYYTPQTVINPLTLWLQVHDIAWNGGKCNYGSIDSDVSTNGSGVNVPSGNNSTALPTGSGVAEMGVNMGFVFAALSAALVVM
ncbi:hypothetical protein ACEPPN_018040 [Leptodophora sp. 'Broadleaf-Isolate-01']